MICDLRHLVKPYRQMMKMMEQYDKELLLHSTEAAMLTYQIATNMQLPDADRDLATAGALLHDLGKTNWPKYMRDKRHLSPIDKKLILSHPREGVKILQQTWPDAPELINRIIKEHHERPSGSGYPSKKDRTKIHYLSQIVAVCESFSAMTCERPYRDKPLSGSEAITILRQQLFNEEIVSAVFYFVNHDLISIKHKGGDK